MPTRNDFNGDGKSDIFWHNRASVYRTWTVDNPNSKSEIWAGALSSGWKVEGTGDFNGDGKVEVLWHNRNGIVEIDSLGASGSTAVGIPGYLDGNWSVAAVGDFNGDGKSDILWKNIGNFYVLWKMNGATITSQQTLGTVPANWQIVGAADFNGDGKADLLWHDVTTPGFTGTGAVEIDTIDSSAGFTRLAALGTLAQSWTGAFLGDFDGDGKNDILWRQTPGVGSTTYFYWRMNGTTEISRQARGVSNDWVLEDTGDYNGDGRTEVLWHNTSTGAVEVDSLGASGFAALGTLGYLDSSWSSGRSSNLVGQARRDIDGDGKSDLFWHNTATVHEAWFMNGTARSLQALGNLDASWKTEGLADFNGDGKAEILFHNTGSGVVEMDTVLTAPARFASLGTAGTLDNSWSAAALGDFSGDGKADILWKNTANFYVAWLMDGTTVSSQQTLGTIPAGWKVEGTGDFNGDGRAEILWHHTGTGVVQIDNLGGGGFTSLGVPGYLDGTWSVAAIGDFDGDGKSDILWKDTGNFHIKWVMDGATVTSQQTLGTVPSAWRVEGSGDFYGIGSEQIVWHNTSSNVVEIDSLTSSGFAKLSSFTGYDSNWTLAGGN